MIAGEYFVSDEAENAATNRVIETFKSANSAVAQFEGEMMALGKELDGLARALKSPKNHLFEAKKEEIMVWENVSGPPFTRRVSLTSQQCNWPSLSELLSNYERARKDKQESAGQLRNMGLPIAD